MAENGHDMGTIHVADEVRRGRTHLLRLEEFLERRSRGFVLLLGLLLLALIALIDSVTGHFDVTIFYLVPVALVTFSRGRWMGLLFAGIASIAWEVAEVANHVTSANSPVTYYNALTRFYVYAAVALMIAPIRAALIYERDAAERRPRRPSNFGRSWSFAMPPSGPHGRPVGAEPAVDSLREVLSSLEQLHGAGKS